MLTKETILFSCALDEAFLTNWGSQVKTSAGLSALEHLYRNNKGGGADGWLNCQRQTERVWKVPGKCLD